MRPWFVSDTQFSQIIEPDDRSAFMRICPERPVPKGGHVFRLGDPATHLHVLAAGQVKLVMPTSSGTERILAVCGPDDFIGEAFLREADRYRVDAIALTDVVTCPMSREQFLQLGLNAPNLVLTFAEILTSNLFRCHDLLGAAQGPVKVRVAAALADQATRFGTAEAEDGWYALRTTLTHDEIAALTGATRVAVTMAMSELRQAGFVEGSRGRYRLYLPGLSDVVEDIL